MLVYKTGSSYSSKKKKNVDESVPIRWNPIHQKDTTYKYYLYYRIAIDYATACMKGEKKTRTHTLVSRYNQTWHYEHQFKWNACYYWMYVSGMSSLKAFTKIKKDEMKTANTKIKKVRFFYKVCLL